MIDKFWKKYLEPRIQEMITRRILLVYDDLKSSQKGGEERYTNLPMPVVRQEPVVLLRPSGQGAVELVIPVLSEYIGFDNFQQLASLEGHQALFEFLRSLSASKESKSIADCREDSAFQSDHLPHQGSGYQR